jgi:dipeptidyl aminopeptidase/acylaminoacyl peptidase
MNPRNTARGLIPVACAFALTLLAAACAAQAPDAASAASARRRFTVDDLFQLESLVEHYGGPFAWSPDGRKLAAARLRPKATWTDYKLDFLRTAGADVWVQPDAGQPLTNITHGVEDGSGWWAPQWSPDGERLAMLSTRGGNVRLWVWEARTGRLRQVTTRGIVLTLARPYTWLNSRQLLYPALPPGDKPRLMQLEIQTQEIAPGQWEKARRGRETTASVLQSGLEETPGGRRSEELLILDADGSASEPVSRGRTRSWAVNADGTVVAFAQGLDRGAPREGLPLAGARGWNLGLLTVGSEGASVKHSVVQDVLPHTIRWTPKGEQLGLLARADGGRQLLLVRISRTGKIVSTVPLDRASPASPATDSHRLAWVDDQRILVRLKSSTGDARTDWWLVRESGRSVCLTCRMAVSPKDLTAVPQTGSFAGIASGELWELGEAGATANRSESFAPRLERFVAHEPEVPLIRTASPRLLFVATSSDGVTRTYSWEPGQKITAVPGPGPNAGVRARSRDGGELVWVSDDATGLRVWRKNISGSGGELLIDANRFLQNVEQPDARVIDYASHDGRPLKARLMLPAAYEAGEKYRLLVWVYPGSTTDSGHHWGINDNSALNLQIPAGCGYAVLIPEMPLLPEGTADDPMLKLQNGVMPAIDKVIAMGIAHPEHVYLMGHSFGGYATLGLITQTQRFRAAVALAGLSNLIADYGYFDPRFRYTSHPLERMTAQAMAEDGQLRMGSPPWQGLDRYIRNSPVFSVDQVRTPVMLVYGDLDYVGMEHGEEFFTALYRMGRRAEFVRYWGEGHVLQSPANIRDLWSRVFAWFDSFHPGPGNASPAAARCPVPAVAHH